MPANNVFQPRVVGLTVTARATLITTVRNGERFLAECIASVRGQTRTDWIHLLLDDGSEDGSLRIAQEAAASDARVQVVARPARGRRAALTEAHALATTEFVAWVDADDRLCARALERTMAVFDEQPGCGMVFTEHSRIDADGRRVRKRPRPPLSAEGMLTDFATFHFRLIRRSVFERAGGIASDLEIAIDYDLCLRLAEVAPIVSLAEPLYEYREHRQQLSTTRRTEQAQASALAIRRAIRRRGLAEQLRLHVAGDPAHFSLEGLSETASRFGARDKLRAFARSVARRPRAPRRARPKTAVVWPAARSDLLALGVREGLHRNGVAAQPSDANLPAFLRSLWHETLPDLIVLHQVSHVLSAANPGSARALRELLVRGLDWARARGATVAWCAWGDVTGGQLEPSTLRAIALRCDAIAVHEHDAFGPLRALGSGWATGHLETLPPPLTELLPTASRSFARSTFGFGVEQHLTFCLGRITDAAALRDLATKYADAPSPGRHLVVFGAAGSPAIARELATAACDAPNVHYLIGRWSRRELGLAVRAADTVTVLRGCPDAWEATVAAATLGRPAAAPGIDERAAEQIGTTEDWASLMRRVIEASSRSGSRSRRR